MSDFAAHAARDARLCMLRELARQTDGRLNETLLTAALEAYGHLRSRDYVRTQLRQMADVGAVTITDMGAIMVAAITRAGTDHVERRSVIEGIARPGPES